MPFDIAAIKRIAAWPVPFRMPGYRRGTAEAPKVRNETMTEDQAVQAVNNGGADPPAAGQSAKKPFASYRRQAVPSNPLLSSIRELNGTFMEITHAYHCAIKRALREVPLTPENLDRIEPLVQDAVQMHRVVSRYTQLDIELQPRPAPPKQKEASPERHADQ
jgi:hypothetical protein